MAIAILPSRASIMALAQLSFPMKASAPNAPVGIYAAANPGYLTAPNGSPTYEARPFGYMGHDPDSRVLVLNGSSSLRMPAPTGWVMGATATMGCWVRRNGAQAAYAQAFGWRGRNQLGIANASAEQEVYYSHHGEPGQWAWLGGPTITNDTWEYVGYTNTAFTATAFAGSRTAVNSGVGHAGFTYTTEVGSIGEDNPFNRYANGRLFEPTIWTPALTDEQLQVVRGGVEPTFNTKISVTVGPPDPDTSYHLTSLDTISVNYLGASANYGFWEIYDQNDFTVAAEQGLEDSLNLLPGVYTARAQVRSSLGGFSRHDDPNSSVTFRVGPEPNTRSTGFSQPLSRSFGHPAHRPLTGRDW